MHHRRFLAQIDEPRVLEAIRDSEKKCSGQIRVFVSHHRVGDALKAAERQFVRLGMAKTNARNAVLIFFAPISQTFAVFGDISVHQKCGAQFWQSLCDDIVPSLKAGQYTVALVGAISKAGKVLAEHFPPEDKPQSPLPDSIVHDR